MACGSSACVGHSRRTATTYFVWDTKLGRKSPILIFTDVALTAFATRITNGVFDNDNNGDMKLVRNPDNTFSLSDREGGPTLIFDQAELIKFAGEVQAGKLGQFAELIAA